MLLLNFTIIDYKISRFSFSDFYLAVSTALAILMNKTTHYQTALLCMYFAACCVVNIHNSYDDAHMILHGTHHGNDSHLKQTAEQ